MRSDGWIDCMAERLDELKAAAALAQTYGDYFQLQDDLEDELEEIRKQIEKTRGEVRRKRAKGDRWELRFGERWDWIDESRDFYARRLAAERAFRDEIREGLRYWKRDLYGPKPRSFTT